jgi:hypothetical protein
MKKPLGAVLLTLLLSSTSVVADEKSDRLEEVKKKIAHHVDTEIGILTQFKTCVQAVKVKADFEACRTTKNDAQTKMREEMKKDRLENRAKARAAGEADKVVEPAKKP